MSSYDMSYSYALWLTMTNEYIGPTVRIQPVNHTAGAKIPLIKCTAGSQVLIQEFLSCSHWEIFPNLLQDIVNSSRDEMGKEQT